MKKQSVSVKKNFVYSMLYQIIALALPLLTTPYVSRVLGAEEIGKYSYAVAMASYFTITATLGSATYGQRTIAYYRDDKEKLSQKFWNILSFRILTAVLASILYIIYLYLFDGITLIKLATGLYIINVAFDISWFFQGIENFRLTVIRGLFVKVVSFLLVFIVIRNQNDTWKYASIVYGCVLLGNITLWHGIKTNINRPKNIAPFEGIKEMWLVFLPTIAAQVYTVLDKSMIGWVTNSNYQNGCYEQSEKLVRAAIVAITSISTVILSKVANLYHNGKDEKAKYYVYKGYQVVLMLALPMMFGFVSVANILIPIYLGPGYELAIQLLKIFSLLLVFVTLASVTGIAYLVPTKQQNIYTVSVVISAIINFIINLLCIPKYGAFGAAIASVVAEAIGVMIQIGYCVKTGQLNIKKIFIPSWKCFMASILMFVVVVGAKRLISQSFVSLFFLIILGIVVYFVVLLILRDKLFLQAVNGIIKKVKRLRY